MTEPKGKKTLPAGSNNGPLPIVVPSPSTQSRSAVTLSPPFDDGSPKASPAIPKAPPIPGAGADLQQPPMRSATKTMVPSERIKTPPQTPRTLKAQKPASLPPKPPASVPPKNSKPAERKPTAIMSHSPVRSEPPAPASKPPSSVRPASEPEPSTHPLPPARDAMLTMPEVPHPQTQTLVIKPAPPAEPVISELDTQWEEPAPPSPRSRPKPPPPPDDLFADLPPASTSAWPPADVPASVERADDAPLAPPSIPPTAAPTDAVGPPALVPVRSPKERLDDAAAWAQRLWKRVEPMGRSAFEDGRRQFLSLGKGQRIAAVACVAGGLSIPVIGLILAIAAPSGPKKTTTASSTETSTQASAPGKTAATPQRTTEAPIVAPSVSSARIVPVAPRRPSICAVAGDPKQFAPRASKDVPIEVRIGASQATAAVGYAVDGGTAAGLVIDLAKLEVVDRFKLGIAKVTRVIPVERDGKFTFEVHGKGKGAHDDHSVLLPTTSKSLRWTKSAVSIADVDGGNAAELWQLEAPADAVRVTSAGTSGAAVALRTREAIQIGWLDSEGKSAGALAPIPNLTGKLGSPSVAWNGRSMLAAFANREQGDEAWNVRLASAEYGKAPALHTAWKPPPGGPGGSAIAPSVAALPSGGWLLVWTEGEQGRREVRMQSLTSELATIGEAVTVSGQGNAGQGVAAVGDTKGIVLDLVGTRAHELWGRSIDCP